MIQICPLDSVFFHLSSWSSSRTVYSVADHYVEQHLCNIYHFYETVIIETFLVCHLLAQMKLHLGS